MNLLVTISLLVALASAFLLISRCLDWIDKKTGRIPAPVPTGGEPAPTVGARDPRRVDLDLSVFRTTRIVVVNHIGDVN